MKPSFNINNVDEIIELLLNQAKRTEESINEIMNLIDTLKNSIKTNSNLCNEWENLTKEIKLLEKKFAIKSKNIDLTYKQYKTNAHDNDYQLIQMIEKSIEQLNTIYQNLEKI